MRSIATVNITFPTIESELLYLSGDSLRDHDIIVFDPEFPYLPRVDFSGGGSCIEIDASKRLRSAIEHWSSEIKNALKAGKTIFFLMNDIEQNLCSSGSTSNGKGHRNYATYPVINYDVLPEKIHIKNAKGKTIVISDGSYRNLLE